MNIGLEMSIFSQSVDVAVLAQRAEELGFESFWLGEHPFIPVETSSHRYPPAAAALGPIESAPRITDERSHLVDSLMALTRAAAVTQRLKVGTAICIVPLRSPLILAKQVATLDQHSRGRFLFGIGGGWVKEEVEIMGVSFRHRWRQTREAILAMKELWAKDEAEFHGNYYDFPPVRSEPKPFQKPHPPVLLAGTATNVFKRVVAWGDGWVPDFLTPEQVKEGRDTLDRLATEAGRDPGAIDITVCPKTTDPEQIKRFAEAGASRLLVRLPTTVGEGVLAEMERMAERVLAR